MSDHIRRRKTTMSLWRTTSCGDRCIQQHVRKSSKFIDRGLDRNQYTNSLAGTAAPTVATKCTIPMNHSSRIPPPGVRAYSRRQNSSSHIQVERTAATANPHSVWFSPPSTHRAQTPIYTRYGASASDAGCGYDGFVEPSASSDPGAHT